MLNNSGTLLNPELSLRQKLIALLKFEQVPEIVNYAMTARGRIILILIVAAAFLPPVSKVQTVFVMIIALSAASFSSIDRVKILTLATLTVLITDPFWYSSTLSDFIAAREHVAINRYVLRYAALAAFFLFSAGYLYAMDKNRPRWVFKYPIFSLLLIFFILAGAAQFIHGLPAVCLWSFISAYRWYIWCLCYAVINRRSKHPDPIFYQFATFHVAWGSSSTPIGKGVSNLRKHEKTNPYDFAVTQLKGLRLLIGMFLLNILFTLLKLAAYGHFGIPTFEAALRQQVNGAPYGILECWECLATGFIFSVLKISIWGNWLIGCARMLGFDLLPNSHRAFLARTIAEFWNRYYFYFKEILVDCFFYPTFLRCFRQKRRLRIAFATFMAASVGNVLFHFMLHIDMVAHIGWRSTFTSFETYSVYSLLLAAGIICSQLMPQNRPASRMRWYRGLAASAKVWIFFCLLQVFDDAATTFSLADHAEFFIRLFAF